MLRRSPGLPAEPAENAGACQAHMLLFQRSHTQENLSPEQPVLGRGTAEGKVLEGVLLRHRARSGLWFTKIPERNRAPLPCKTEVPELLNQQSLAHLCAPADAM